MRRASSLVRELAALTCALAVASVSAIAGQNPHAAVFIDFSGTADSWYLMHDGGWDNETYPQLGEQVDAYVGLFTAGTGTWNPDHTHEPPAQPQVTGGSFRLEWPAESLAMVEFSSLLPGDLAIGSPDAGITVSSTQCVQEPVVYLLRVTLEYLGVPGDLLVVDHPDYPRWIVDCHSPMYEVDYYCVASHGGVGKSALLGEENCSADVPVQRGTWASLKALYR